MPGLHRFCFNEYNIENTASLQKQRMTKMLACISASEYALTYLMHVANILDLLLSHQVRLFI